MMLLLRTQNSSRFVCHTKKVMIDVTKLIELKQCVIEHTDPKVYIIENVYVTKLSTNGDLVIIIESDIIS